jgi:hypothetical protein
VNTSDKILDDPIRSDGQKRKNKEVVRSTTTKVMQIQHLEKMLKVSSGKHATTYFVWMRMYTTKWLMMIPKRSRNSMKYKHKKTPSKGNMMNVSNKQQSNTSINVPYYAATSKLC